MSDFDTLSADLDTIAARDASLLTEINDLRSQLAVAQQASPVDLSPLIDKADKILALVQTPATGQADTTTEQPPATTEPAAVDTTTQQPVDTTTEPAADTTSDQQSNADTAGTEQADTTGAGSSPSS